MIPQPRIRTAILGYGRSGSTLHADPIEKLSAEFDLRAVCDIDPAAREKAGRRFACALHDDYRAMLRAGGLDLVVIVTRSDQHGAMTCDCLAAGVDVLVTKPWALDEAEARRMIDAARSSGRRLLPWLPARWGCDLLRLREIVASGAIGKVHLVRRAEMTLGTRSDWQTRRRHGGGYLLNWGPHLVDQPLQLHGGRVLPPVCVREHDERPGPVDGLQPDLHRIRALDFIRPVELGLHFRRPGRAARIAGTEVEKIEKIMGVGVICRTV